MLLFMVNAHFFSTAVYHDAVLAVPELPGASVVHDAALLLIIVVYLSGVWAAVRAPEDLMELGGREELPVLALYALLSAVGLHLLEREVVIQQDVDQALLLFVLFFVLDDGLVLFGSSGADLYDVITKGSGPATPEAHRCEVVQVVPDPEGVVPDLEPGEDHSQVHHGLADGRSGIYAVLDGDELDALLLQEGVEGAEVHHVGADAVDAVDHHAVDQAVRHILPQLVHGRAIDV